MAAIRVRHSGLIQMARNMAKRADRAKNLPKRYVLSTNSTLAALNQRGGLQRGGRRMQRAIAAKTKASPPSLATLASGLRHPKRPVRVTPAMLRRAGNDLVAHVLRGKTRGVRLIMIDEVGSQFDAGGDPSWKPSRSWGAFRAAIPTLGGRSGRIGSAWKRGSYAEVR